MAFSICNCSQWLGMFTHNHARSLKLFCNKLCYEITIAKRQLQKISVSWQATFAFSWQHLKRALITISKFLLAQNARSCYVLYIFELINLSIIEIKQTHLSFYQRSHLSLLDYIIFSRSSK